MQAQAKELEEVKASLSSHCKFLERHLRPRYDSVRMCACRHSVQSCSWKETGFRSVRGSRQSGARLRRQPCKQRQRSMAGLSSLHSSITRVLNYIQTASVRLNVCVCRAVKLAYESQSRMKDLELIAEHEVGHLSRILSRLRQRTAHLHLFFKQTFIAMVSCSRGRSWSTLHLWSTRRLQKQRAARCRRLLPWRPSWQSRQPLSQ